MTFIKKAENSTKKCRRQVKWEMDEFDVEENNEMQ